MSTFNRTKTGNGETITQVKEDNIVHMLPQWFSLFPLSGLFFLMRRNEKKKFNLGQRKDSYHTLIPIYLCPGPKLF